MFHQNPLGIDGATISSRNRAFVNILWFHIVGDPVIKIVPSQFYSYWRVSEINFFRRTFSDSFSQNIPWFERSVVALVQFPVAQTVLA